MLSAEISKDYLGQEGSEFNTWRKDVIWALIRCEIWFSWKWRDGRAGPLMRERGSEWSWSCKDVDIIEWKYEEMSSEKLLIMHGIYQVPFFLESSNSTFFSPLGVENKWPYFLFCSFGDVGIPDVKWLMLITYHYQKPTFPGFIERF